LSEPRAIAADFVTFRHVQGRKVLQVVCEVPVEEMGKVFDVLGTPSTGENLWIVLAPMPKQAPAGPSAAAPTHKSFNSLPLVQQVGIRCSDALFQEFMGVELEVGAAEAVRAKCAVDSRKDIIEGSPAGAIWKQIERQYQSWLTDRKFAETRR
jgi:hypothetical protein